MGYFDDSVVLDHMVINVHHDMDAAQATFEALGFQLTPRGKHTLGSINHLMMFGSDYLELLGLPAGSDARPELLATPKTLDGLVFKTDDADATFAHMKSLGMDGDPPRAFTRPLTIDGKQAEAAFRTVTVRSDVFAGGRVYFCEHGTPEYLWHEPWMVHDNGVKRTLEFVIVSGEPAEEAARYAALVKCGSAPAGDGVSKVDLGESALTLMTRDAYRARFGDLAVDGPADRSFFGALVLGCDSLDAIGKIADAPPAGCRARRSGDAIQVAVDPVNALLEFRT